MPFEVVALGTFGFEDWAVDPASPPYPDLRLPQLHEAVCQVGGPRAPGIKPEPYWLRGRMVMRLKARRS